jgi:hypothetical protein
MLANRWKLMLVKVYLLQTSNLITVNLMAYPTVNLSSANAIFSVLGIVFEKHELGYYQARGQEGQVFQNAKLIDLTHEVLKELCSPKAK